MSHFPYCEHPDCHSARTAQYCEAPVTGTNGTDWTEVHHPLLMVLGGRQLPGWRRWCHVHALMFEGWAFGS